MLVNGPDVQYCGDVYIEIGEPISNVYFKKEDAVAGFDFVWLKTCGGYSDFEDFILKLNGSVVDVCDEDEFFIKYVDLVKDDNVFQIELKEPGSYQYFRSMFIFPIRYEGDTELGLIEIEKW